MHVFKHFLVTTITSILPQSTKNALQPIFDNTERVTDSNTFGLTVWSNIGKSLRLAIRKSVDVKKQ